MRPNHDHTLGSINCCDFQYLSFQPILPFTAGMNDEDVNAPDKSNYLLHILQPIAGKIVLFVVINYLTQGVSVYLHNLDGCHPYSLPILSDMGTEKTCKNLPETTYTLMKNRVLK